MELVNFHARPEPITTRQGIELLATFDVYSTTHTIKQVQLVKYDSGAFAIWSPNTTSGPSVTFEARLRKRLLAEAIEAYRALSPVEVDSAA